MAELVGQHSGPLSIEEPSQFHQVPGCVVPPASKPRPDSLAMLPIVGEDGASVVQLVGQSHQEDVVGGLPQMLEVALFALAPGRPRLVEGIGAALDDGGNPLAEPVPDVVQALPAAMVLGRVVKQSRDRLILVTTRLQDQGADRHGMRDVGRPAPDPQLIGVHLRRVVEALFEPAADQG